MLIQVELEAEYASLGSKIDANASIRAQLTCLLTLVSQRHSLVRVQTFA